VRFKDFVEMGFEHARDILAAPIIDPCATGKILMRNVYLITLFVCVLLVSILGLRGVPFILPPMDVFPEWAFPGMKYQPKFRPQSASEFFADGRADRMPPEHTVARGMLADDDIFFRGKDAAGAWARSLPPTIPVDMKLLERGRDRYTIYCQVCHGVAGDGNGITVRYGMGSLTTNGNYHTDRIRAMADGELFNAITNGSVSKIMLPYADKLEPADRWAVVAYIRALQRTQQGTATDVTDAAARQTLGIQ
jgi:mono/diheme cytochrome c family protein